jgi:hypothetical protein
MARKNPFKNVEKPPGFGNVVDPQAEKERNALASADAIARRGAVAFIENARASLPDPLRDLTLRVAAIEAELALRK